MKRLGDDGDGEDPEILGQRRDDRRGPGTGAAAETGGDEHHVGAFQEARDLVGIFEGGVAAHVGIRPGAEPLRQLQAQLDFHRCRRRPQRLAVGVGHDELHARELSGDHAGDRVAAPASEADDLDLGRLRSFV